MWLNRNYETRLKASHIKSLLPTLVCSTQTAQFCQKTSPLPWTSPGSCTTRVGSAQCDSLLWGQNISCGSAPASPGNLVSPHQSAAQTRSWGHWPDGPEGWKFDRHRKVPHTNEAKDPHSTDGPQSLRHAQFYHHSRKAAEFSLADIFGWSCCHDMKEGNRKQVEIFFGWWTSRTLLPFHSGQPLNLLHAERESKSGVNEMTEALPTILLILNLKITKTTQWVVAHFIYCF